MRSILFSALFTFLACACFAKEFPAGSLFLGQTPPGNTPKALPLFVNHGFFAAERIAISNDGRDIYYSEIKSYYPIRGENIKRYTFSDGKWNGPFDLFIGFGPALSLTGDTMYFERKGSGNKSETYISVRKGSGWGNPKRILTRLDKAHYYQVTKSGNQYISSIAGNGAGLNDWCKVVTTGADTTASSLERPLNTGGDNLDFFVSQDESYMIVTNRPGLAISYRKEDGSWTNPRNFGPKIDFGLGSWGPWVTPDNKFLFYTTGTKPDYSDVAVYWVRIDSAIDSLKNTNISPYIRSLIQNLTATAGQPFSFSVPDNIFYDEDNNAPLTYSAIQISGEPLPSWIRFDPGTKTFSGTPAETGEINIRIVVTDKEKATAFCPLKIIITKNGPYLGQTPPGTTPKIFALMVKPDYFAAERIAISNDGMEIYYSELKGYYPNTGESVKKNSFSDDKWTGPVTLFEGYAAPALSVTGDTMYIESNFETFYSVKNRSGWTKPKRILSGLDSAHYYQATRNGNYYISTKSGKGAGLSDWRKVTIIGSDTIVSSLGRPLNTGGEDLDFFVSRDESFMIVTNRPRLAISYKKEDGSWTNPKNFGPEIDFGLASWGPFVTTDNKYLFYTTGTKPDYSDCNVYWVRIDGIIDSLKHTNQVPYIKSLIDNQTAFVRQPFSYSIPDNIFFDDDSYAPLTFSASLMNGDPLPSWISFDPGTRTFSGTPVEAGELTVKVLATDSEKTSAYCPVKIISHEDVTIGKYRKFQSGILEGEVTYLVHLPDGYENSKKNYPVVYMMNGQSVSSFANAAATLDNLSNERIPDMILIGISNTGVAAGYRSCPDDSGNVRLGDSFSKFLREDLIPEIKRNYRTNDYKILFGQSNTGLFVLYNLLKQPDMFNAYVVASPMFGWCPQFYAEQTSTFLKNNPSLNKKLYVSYGDLDYVEVLRHINDFKEILKQSQAGFQWQVDLIENAGHVPFMTLNSALLYIFSECTINEERKKFSIPEIKTHFEKLSAEYGFTVVPKAGVLFDMAIDKKNEKEFERAVDLFKYLINLYPGSEIYHYVLGQTYQLKGDVDLAKESFSESLKINPDFPQARRELDKLAVKK